MNDTPMTDEDKRRWAAEQAVLSFGAAGCSDNWTVQRRIELFLDALKPPPPAPYVGPLNKTMFVGPNGECVDLSA